MTEVRRLRIARGLTQAKLADLAGISVITIKRMEMNPRERKGGISIRSACYVADALEVEVMVAFPNTTINPTQGRPAGSGTDLIRKPVMKKAMFCPNCKMQVSAVEADKEISDCHEAKLVA